MAEWLLRNSLPFLVLVLMSRFVSRPRLGKRGVVDIVMINAVGDLAAHTAFETQHPMLPGLASVAAWLGLLAGLALLSSRWPALERSYFHPPVRVVSDGVVDEAALLDLAISRTQLESELRRNGVDSLSQVKQATVEPDGAISVIKENPTAAELRRLAGALSALAARLEEPRP